jgi:hypothetical protein
MNERQHHLNESSSAILGSSQKLKILPSPNSKETQSLGANFLMDAKLWRIHLIFAANICHLYFVAYVCHLHLPPTMREIFRRSSRNQTAL